MKYLLIAGLFLWGGGAAHASQAAAQLAVAQVQKNFETPQAAQATATAAPELAPFPATVEPAAGPAEPVSNLGPRPPAGDLVTDKPAH